MTTSVTLGDIAAALGCVNDNAAMLAAVQARREELAAARRQIDDLQVASRPSGMSFQARVDPWLIACFGEVIARDRSERNHRFLEEALELVQASGCTADEAHQLVNYVFGRSAGVPGQEVGGVMNTLAALCLAHGLDMHGEGERELARVWDPATLAKIRAKQAAKPKHSPLPGHSPSSIACDRESTGEQDEG